MKRFWDNYKVDNKNWLELQFIENRYIVGMNILYSIFRDENELRDVLEYSSQESREKFLITYILPLLEKGELKVKVRDVDIRIPTAKDKEKYPHLKEVHAPTTFFEINEIEYSKPEQANDAIKDIRKRWDKYTDSDLLRVFEDWGVIFTLPENEWAM